MSEQQSANSYQVGGQHYKTGYEHWDLTIDIGMGYLEGCATKYVARHAKKNGVEDLRKALHYTNKLIELAPRLAVNRHPNSPWVRMQCLSFFEENGLEGRECPIIMRLALWQTPEDLLEVQRHLLELIESVEAPPVPLTEENHHADRVGAYSEGDPAEISGT